MVTYEGLIAEANDNVTFFDGTKTKYLSITLDSNIETKTIRIVAISGSTEETAIPKDIYISSMKTYAFIENPDNSDELCYLGLALESYDDFRIRDTDNN